MRKTAALVLAGLVAASLAACSSPTPTQSGCVPAASGSVSDSVSVSGDFGKKPKVEFSEPLSAETTERTVDIAGKESKEYAEPNDEVSINFSLFNGTTGKEIIATDYTTETEELFTIDEKLYPVGLIRTLACSSAGSRVVGVIPPADAWGAEGQADLGIAAGESIVFVADVMSILPAGPDRSTGVPQDPTPGMPTVTFDKDGVPTITIPDTAPPSKLQIALLKKGDGAVVQEGDSVKVQYVGVNWNTKEIFDQSWDSGPVSFATTGVVAGFGQALVGQAVGSQVLVVIPPDLGYGPSGGTPDGSIGATDTIVFVIDILRTSAS